MHGQTENAKLNKSAWKKKKSEASGIRSEIITISSMQNDAWPLVSRQN